MNRLDDIIKWGFLPYENGTVILTNEAEHLFRAWINYWAKILKPLYDEKTRTPFLIREGVLEKAGYLKNFPQQLMRLHNQDSYVSPAACLHTYPRLEKESPLLEVRSQLIFGACGRLEDGRWTFPFRSANFHMLELVAVGPAEGIDIRRQEALRQVQSAFDRLRMDGSFIAATDAFFLGESEGAKLMQKLKQSKQEYSVDIADQTVALASINNHEDHFTNRFNITSTLGPTNSFCIAFGIERLVAYGLLKWGGRPSDWPTELNNEIL